MAFEETLATNCLLSSKTFFIRMKKEAHENEKVKEIQELRKLAAHNIQEAKKVARLVRLLPKRIKVINYCW